MTIQSVGFIGAGRVARILLGGWKKAQALPSSCVLSDVNPEAAAPLMALGAGIEVADAIRAAAQDVVFLAVHPPVLKDAIESIKANLQSNAIVVSLAPKFTIAKISELLGGFGRVARMIPNAPSLVGRGYNPIACASTLGDGDKAGLLRLFAPLGDCPQVDERHLEAYAILAAMGPTYFWPQLYALKSLGESFGLPGDSAMQALDKMLWGAVATMRESGLPEDQVRDLIPVKPMADEVESLSAAYNQKLGALMDKIRPM